MRRTARAIVIRDNQLLVMHRNKFGQQYFALVGGEIEIGESPEQALVREVNEETRLEIANPRLVFIEEAGEPYGTQYIYVCDYVAGEPSLHPASQEALIMAAGKNLYIPMWLPLSDLEAAPFLSKELKEHILTALEKGFGTAPETFHSHAEIGYTKNDN